MLIKEEQLRYWIDNFYGYGSWDATIWFVGYEEGGGELPEEVAEKFNHFYGQPRSKTLCDLREMYRKVTYRNDGPRADMFATLYDYRFGNKAGLHGSWKNLIAFAHGFKRKKLPDLLAYQRKSFAVKDEALISLYPLPSAHNHAWYYSWLDMPALTFLKYRSSYEEHVYHGRVTTILKNIAAYKPQVVVMYGMNNINILKQSVQEFFPDTKFKMIKSTKLEIPQHHRADLAGTTLIITTQIPTLRHNRIESGFNWEQFGKDSSADL